jgi:hypothetical protein
VRGLWMTIMQEFREGACNDTVIYCISEKALLCLARGIRPGFQRRMAEQSGRGYESAPPCFNGTHRCPTGSFR